MAEYSEWLNILAQLAIENWCYWRAHVIKSYQCASVKQCTTFFSLNLVCPRTFMWPYKDGLRMESYRRSKRVVTGSAVRDYWPCGNRWLAKSLAINYIYCPMTASWTLFKVRNVATFQTLSMAELALHVSCFTCIAVRHSIIQLASSAKRSVSMPRF